MSLLLPDSGLLFWMLLSFGVVFVVLAKFGFPVITQMVEGRRTYIDQSLEMAKEANEQLSRLKAESDALVAAANKEQGRILREAMHERDKIIVEARKQAEVAAQKELDEVRRQIQQEKEEAIKAITLPEKLTIKELAEKMKIQATVIIKKLFLKGTMLTVNQEVDYDTAEEIALEFNCIAEPEEKVDVLSVDIAEKIIRKNLNEQHEQMDMIDRMLDEVLSASRQS